LRIVVKDIHSAVFIITLIELYYSINNNSNYDDDDDYVDVIYY
jgi:hypothetical protein